VNKGYLIINVYADNIAQPVNEAEIEIRGNSTNIKIKTDNFGKSEKIALDAPNKEYSLTPQTQVKPYSEYSIEVKKPGLKTVIIEGIEVFDGETSIQNVYLTNQTNGKAKAEKPEYYELPAHGLWGEYSPKIVEEPLKNEEENLEERVLPFVVIPEYVIVHDGIPTNTSAPSHIVSFPEYIKNVASHEIYSTWPKETIKANVIAIISFTLNRIFTEWYRSNGYAFTITSSTAYDQKYNHNGTIFGSISDVVDEIFNQYIKLPNVRQPFFAQYNDGIKTNNRGWLSQWGSKTLGDQGYDALRILRHYYSNDMYIETAEEIEGLPLSFPGFKLTIDSCGESVQKLQNEINVINGNYPGIAKILPADGKYGTNTQSSVRKFQEVFNLPINGTVDFATWYKISYIYVAVSKMLRGIYA